MLYVETDMASHKTIRKCLDKAYPQARTEHITTDRALKALEFVDWPICVFSLDMTWDEFENMMDALIQLEVDAFNTDDGEMPAEDDEDYQRYMYYGWLWDMFYQAQERKKITEK